MPKVTASSATPGIGLFPCGGIRLNEPNVADSRRLWRRPCEARYSINRQLLCGEGRTTTGAEAGAWVGGWGATLSTAVSEKAAAT
jgi:hypothetical protein